MLGRVVTAARGERETAVAGSWRAAGGARVTLEIVFHIERGDLLDIVEHPNPVRYAGQRIVVVRREDYVYLVPLVEDEHAVFLKTIIPSRKATEQYLGGESDDEA